MDRKPGSRKIWIVLSLIIVLIVTLTPGNGKIAGAYLDKVVHFIIFFFLSVSLCHAHWSDSNLIKLILWAILLGFVTEIIQHHIPGRNLEFNDALADTLGVIVGYYFYQRFAAFVNKYLD